ncbi:hypothetical protein RHRU231_520018 [Rhodococcus ruber]|uniref:Uncharacterized protein n=1 Tax=Rhodococcus ruber TaxID=1830 RepID=A0A098BLQ9_9NOCA|nr:hypothetical protein RHRU231_520018 [Rhodococcus ruber]
MPGIDTGTRQRGGATTGAEAFLRQFPLGLAQPESFPVSEDHGADRGRDQQGAGEFERPDVPHEDQLGQAGDVAGGVRCVEAGELGDGGVAETADEQQAESEAGRDRGDPLAAQRLDERVGGVDADEHDHEQEQHHHRPRVDHDLHDSEEQRILGDVEHREDDHGDREEHRRIDGLGRGDDAECAEHRERSEDPEQHGLAGGGAGDGFGRQQGRRHRVHRDHSPLRRSRHIATASRLRRFPVGCDGVLPLPGSGRGGAGRGLGHRAEVVVLVGRARVHVVGWCHHAGPERGEQPGLVVDQVGPVVVGHLVLVGHGQRPRRAGLDAQTASDAAQVVDLVDASVALPRRVSPVVGVVRALDVDGVGGARPGTQLAPDALLEPVGVAVELVAAVVARCGRFLLLGVSLGLGLVEHRPEGDAESGDGIEEVRHRDSPRWSDRHGARSRRLR